MGNLVKLCYKGHIRVLNLTVNELPFGGRNRNNPEQDRTYDLLHYIPVLYHYAISSFLWIYIQYNTWYGRWLQLEESLQRWNSQRKKVHRLAYGFSIDFKIYRLAYGFIFFVISLSGLEDWVFIPVRSRTLTQRRPLNCRRRRQGQTSRHFVDFVVVTQLLCRHIPATGGWPLPDA